MTDKESDREVLEKVANDISELCGNGVNKLIQIKVCINPKYRKANIYAEYRDESRVRGKELDDSTGVTCEELITWPHSEVLENTEETWIDFNYPKRQMERALLLSCKLKQRFVIINCADELKCYIKDGKAFIDRV